MNNNKEFGCWWGPPVPFLFWNYVNIEQRSLRFLELMLYFPAPWNTTTPVHCALYYADFSIANFEFSFPREHIANSITNTDFHTCRKYAGNSTINTLFHSFKYRSLHGGTIHIQYDTSDIIVRLTTCGFAIRCPDVGRNSFTGDCLISRNTYIREWIGGVKSINNHTTQDFFFYVRIWRGDKVIGWWTGRLTVRLIDQLIILLTDFLPEWKATWMTNCLIDRLTDRLTD